MIPVAKSNVTKIRDFEIKQELSTPELASCLAHWRYIWEYTFASVGDQRRLLNDAFYAADICHAYWHGNKPLGLVLRTDHNSMFPGLAKLSQFDGWPQSFFELLEKNNIQSFCHLSHLSVHPAFRKRKAGGSIAVQMVELALSRILWDSKHDDAFMLVRSSRGVDKILRNLGAKDVDEIKHFGEDSHLFHFDFRPFR